ncbi:DUF3099 domain-containing protein [Nocardioides sp. GY 10127]|uniref:DUF3099 domain-containing protein n=1 Tax=Nocardioides sp. GY 10127 TaxID=2569762 RepID=UPI0010A811D8|nr:DUF3099 domain-containing protein [Nocardioides sp. GY 10127]TIC83945.1 DUF3099 domain-containing protein [Nocardioides sp. GY 10127]
MVSARPRARRAYFWIMGTCLTLVVVAWTLVRLVSPATAIAMSAVAAVLPPVAVIVGSWGAFSDLEDGPGEAPPQPARRPVLPQDHPENGRENGPGTRA